MEILARLPFVSSSSSSSSSPTSPTPSSSTAHLYLYAVVISAVDGKLLRRVSRTHESGTPFRLRVWADPSSPHVPYDGPQGHKFNPYPYANFSKSDRPTLQYVPSSLITLTSGPISTGDPWIDGSSSNITTSGNNVIVKSIETVAGFRPIGINRTIDCQFDASADASKDNSQVCGATSAVFFMINWLHDWFYDVGFNEAAGNGQMNNYGRGGLGKDPVLSMIHDITGVNNAYMLTPDDGSSPEMHMFLWPSSDNGNATLTSPKYNIPVTWTSDWGSPDFDITAEFVLVNDRYGEGSDGCQQIQNNVTGKIAVFSLGGCNNTIKTNNAVAAGAISVIILTDVNNNYGVYAVGDPFDAEIGLMGLYTRDSSNLRLFLTQQKVMGRVYRKLVRYDGAVDNSIVAHEWGHYLAHRLVPSLLNSQARAMGEGWSDFVALLVTIREDDGKLSTNFNWTGSYAISQYASQASTNNSIYYGLRRLPYTTDMKKNPLTFKHIYAGGTLPQGVPYAFKASSNSEVHSAGEIWALTLWECYSTLLRDTMSNNSRLTFQDAQNRMKSYLVASFKITPSNPTYLEARDAMLMAAYHGDKRDYELFCSAFAKRGMGMQAVAPFRYSTRFEDIKESYYCGSLLRISEFSLKDDIISCDNDGILDRGEYGTMRITIENYSLMNMTNMDVGIQVNCSEDFLNFLEPNVKKIGFLSGASQLVLTFAVNFSREANLTVLYPADIWISFVNYNELPVINRVIDYTFNYDVEANISTVDEILDKQTNWIVSKPGEWQITDGQPIVGVEGLLWHGNDGDRSTDIRLTSPDLEVGNGTNFTIHFEHSYFFEYDDVYSYDGGVVELFDYRSNYWLDLMSYVSPFFKSRLSKLNKYSNNTLASRLAYASKSPGYPALYPEMISLGNIFANQKVKIRFRIGTDELEGSDGWYIRNIGFDGIVNSPFPGIMEQTCTPVLTPPPTPSPTPIPTQYHYQPPQSSSSSSINPIIFLYLFFTIFYFTF